MTDVICFQCGKKLKTGDNDTNASRYMYFCNDRCLKACIEEERLIQEDEMREAMLRDGR